MRLGWPSAVRRPSPLWTARRLVPGSGPEPSAPMFTEPRSVARRARTAVTRQRENLSDHVDRSPGVVPHGRTMRTSSMIGDEAARGGALIGLDLEEIDHPTAVPLSAKQRRAARIGRSERPALELVRRCQRAAARWPQAAARSPDAIRSRLLRIPTALLGTADDRLADTA